MKAKVLMTLLLSALAAPVAANESFESVFIGPALNLAQMGPEQRRQMRERWEQASPEERLEMRRQSQERQERGQWGVRIPAPSDFAAPANSFSGNFGAGFEQRRPEQEESAPFYDPRNRLNPAGRNRR